MQQDPSCKYCMLPKVQRIKGRKYSELCLTHQQLAAHIKLIHYIMDLKWASE